METSTQTAPPVASTDLFADPCRDCKWWVLATPDYRRCERGASPSYASQLGRCAKRESKSDSANAATHGPGANEKTLK